MTNKKYISYEEKILSLIMAVCLVTTCILSMGISASAAPPNVNYYGERMQGILSVFRFFKQLFQFFAAQVLLKH